MHLLLCGQGRRESNSVTERHHQVLESQDHSGSSPNGATDSIGPDGEKIRVLIVDDHGHVWEIIKAVIALDQGIQVVGEAANGLEAVAAARRPTPNVILMDITMPLMDGLEATKRIRIEFPSARVLILSQYDDEHHRNRAIMNGASGFLSKTLIRDGLVPAIRMVASGGLSL